MIAELAAMSVAPAAMGMFVILGIIVLLASIFWIWMIIDVLTSNMETGEKVLWFLVVFLLHLLGAIIYFVVRRQPHGHGGTPALR
jgi:hypothetical protein